MQNKPWIIIIIGLCHLAEPFVKIFYYSFLLSKNPLVTFAEQFTYFNPWHIYIVFFNFPLAGIAILSVKKWSVPVFLTAQVLVVFDFIYKFKGFVDGGQIAVAVSLVVFTIVNIVLVSYLLGSSLKIAFLDPKVRWWESYPRYLIKKPGMASFGEVEVHDLSRSGAYIASSEIPSSDFNLSLELMDEKLSLKCSPVHEITLYDKPGCGVKFIELSWQNRRSLRRLSVKFEKAGFQRRPEKIPFLQGLINWLKNTTVKEKIFPLSTIRK